MVAFFDCHDLMYSSSLDIYLPDFFKQNGKKHDENLTMLKLIYYVPESHLESTKQAIFTVGAGGIGNYEQCAWQVLGMGQFKPVKGAAPYIGELNQLEQVPEWRVETIVPEEQAAQVARALKASHPYEEPAFEFIQIIEIQV